MLLKGPMNFKSIRQSELFYNNAFQLFDDHSIIGFRYKKDKHIIKALQFLLVRRSAQEKACRD